MVVNEIKVERNDSTTDRMVINTVIMKINAVIPVRIQLVNKYKLKVQRRNNDSTTDRMKYERYRLNETTFNVHEDE